jgi:AbrB family looped-hinge helix DNA binding protein
MESAYVTSKGQLVIPAKIRRKLGIKPGTKICFVEREHEVLFQPVTKEHIRNLAGMLKSTTSATGELLKERKLDRDREEKKLARRRAR